MRRTVHSPVATKYGNARGSLRRTPSTRPATSASARPTASTTITLNTTVVIPDGGTVLMGGLKTLSEGRNEFGPPILSKIPYISRLFKNVGYGREAQSLMVMVTARIIINEEEEQIFLGQLPPVPRP